MTRQDDHLPHARVPLSTSRRALVGTTLAAALGGPAVVTTATRASSGRPAAGSQSTPVPASGERASFTVTASDGLTLAAEAQGDPVGPEIVFIHGVRQAGLLWDQQFDDPQLAGFRMVRYDLRGHGNSGRPEDPAAYGDLGIWGDDLAAVIAAAGLRRPVLVGWSLGGQIIGTYLDRYGGDAIAALNLVDAVTSTDPAYFTPEGGTLAQGLSAPDLGERADAIAAFLGALFAVRPEPATFERLLVVNAMPPLAMDVGSSQWELPDLDAIYAAFAGPVVVTFGEQDRLFLQAMPERLVVTNPNATLSVYPGAGHAPFFEQPERFGRELAALVSSVAPS